VKKWNIIIDLEKCNDCNNCFLACKDEHVDNEWPGYSKPQPRHGHRWIDILRKERGSYPLIDVVYLPKLCMHCDNAPCIRAANGAVCKRHDGIVIIDPIRAKGLRELGQSCPYGAIWWNEQEEVPQKCSFCAHLIDGGWKEPRCVQACPAGALRVEYVNADKIREIIRSEQLEVLNSQENTQPRVYYKNMYRYAKCFIAGSIAYEHNGKTDCVEGARVNLFNGYRLVCETTTDIFGDFKFDNLEANNEKYIIQILVEGKLRKTLEVDLQASINVGTICLL
jgi:Fe-S-cluster-containing dehydrogenase component